MKKWMILLSALCEVLASDLPRGAYCWLGPVTRAAIGTRQGKGIGFDEGYSTAQLFVTPNWVRTFQPFMDMRGHIFNDGRFALNLGLGGRWLTEWNFAFGMNAYYDFRSEKAFTPHQVGAGVEFLSHWVDFRANGYFPVAGTERKGPAHFVGFQGNSPIVSRRLSAAYSVVNAEVGFPLRGYFEPAGLYLALGPYYLFRKEVDHFNFGNSWGGEVCLNSQILDGIDIGGHFAYDRLFDGTLNGYVTIRFPFGPATLKVDKERWKKRWPQEECSRLARRQRLATQPVKRHEIIPLKEKKVEDVGRDPLTGDPISMVFVSTMAVRPGVGTFELPFDSLELAIERSKPCQMIYLETGPDPIDGGVVLKEGQTLHGSGTDLHIEEAIFPAQTQSKPLILSDGEVALTLGRSAVIRGINVESQNAHAIDVSQTSSYLLTNLSVRGGIYGDGAKSGVKVIERCRFGSVENMPAVSLKSLDHSKVFIHHNYFAPMDRAINYGGASYFEVMNNRLDRACFGLMGELESGNCYARICGNHITSKATAIGFVMKSDQKMAHVQIYDNHIIGRDRFVDPISLVAEKGCLEVLVERNFLQEGNGVFKVKQRGAALCLRLKNNWCNGAFSLMNFTNDTQAFTVDALNLAPSGVEALNHSGRVLVPFEPIDYRPVDDHLRFFTPFKEVDEK